MHKKRVYKKDYFYTTIRDKGKTKSIYLGGNYKKAKLKESKLKNINKSNNFYLRLNHSNIYIFLMIIIIISLGAMVFLKFNYTGYVILNQFNNNLESEQLVFTDGIIENITRYISINKNMNISSAYINLTGIANYANQTDGFYTMLTAARYTASYPDDIATNGSDFWIINQLTPYGYVYHFNRTGANISGGFEIESAGVTGGMSIATNNSDFWILDQGDNFVYHFNSSGANQTDGIYIGSAGCVNGGGITTNGSDFWIPDNTDKFIYHFNRTGANQTDGIYIGSAGINNVIGIITNNSDFWTVDLSSNFVYHFNRTGANQTDSFYVGSAGINGGIGITTNVTSGGTPRDFWILDQGGNFVYHFKLTIYPSNPYLDVGNDSLQEWNHTGTFDLIDNKTTDLAPAIISYLSTCTADTNGNCTIPFVFHSDTDSIISYYAISISANDTENPAITLTPSAITTIGSGASLIVSCSATDDIAVESVSLTIDGTSCSGTTSCSTTYSSGITGTRTLSCTATDTSGNIATRSVDIVVSLSGSGGDGGGETTPPAEEEIPPLVLEQPSEEIPQEISIPIPPLDYTPIIIPTGAITTGIEGNSIFVDIGNLAKLTYSFIDVSGIKKPKVDILFSQENLKEIRGLIEIKYFDILKYIIISLSCLILLLISINVRNQFRIKKFK